MYVYTVTFTLKRAEATYALFLGALRHVEMKTPMPRDLRSEWVVRTRETAPALATRLKALMGPFDVVTVVPVESAPPT